MVQICKVSLTVICKDLFSKIRNESTIILTYLSANYMHTIYRPARLASFGSNFHEGQIMINNLVKEITRLEIDPEAQILDWGWKW